MPVHKIQGGYQYGNTGKKYYGKDAKKKAKLQELAIRLSGYKDDDEKKKRRYLKHEADSETIGREFVSEFFGDDHLAHHGVLGQKWGKRNGPPYPLDAKGHQMIDDLNTKWDYGVLVDGKRVTDTSQMDWSKYRTLPVEKLAKEKIGVCWDFVNYQHAVCKKNGYPDKNYMIVCRRSNDPNDILTHTFTVVDIGGKSYWLESARWKDRGVHEVKSYRDVVKKLQKDDFGNKPYDLYEFNPDGMDKGLTDTEYFDKATQNLVETSQKNYKKIT